MNTAHVGGADSGTYLLKKRRFTSLLVLVCTLLCFSAGETFLPSAAHANSGKSPSSKSTALSAQKASAKKSTVRTTRAKTQQRKRPLYVRSLLSGEERAALFERGIYSGYGERAISKTRKRMHKGIDVSAPRDSKIIAFNDGEVIFAGVKNGYGKTVIIRQIDGREALYAHMNKHVVSAGDTVKRGDHIGFVGRTGRATGCHLHFELIDDGENLDPSLHVWHGSELVLGPDDLDPDTVGKTRVAEPTRQGKSSVY